MLPAKYSFFLYLQFTAGQSSLHELIVIYASCVTSSTSACERVCIVVSAPSRLHASKSMGHTAKTCRIKKKMAVCNCIQCII